MEKRGSPIALVVDSLRDSNAPIHDTMAVVWAGLADFLRSGKEESDRFVLATTTGADGEKVNLLLVYPPHGGW